MTHDELLDRIAQAGLEPHGNIMPTHLVLALRAVVELHKPWAMSENDLRCGCFDCTDGYSVYPCLTIQAIEEKLK